MPGTVWVQECHAALPLDQTDFIQGQEGEGYRWRVLLCAGVVEHLLSSRSTKCSCAFSHLTLSVTDVVMVLRLQMRKTQRGQVTFVRIHRWL
jgi:hypothetical protein